MPEGTGSSKVGAGGSGGGNQGQGTGDQGMGTGQSQGQTSGQGQDQGQGLVFDNWIKEQAKQVQEMLETHEKGLKSALADERSARGDLEKKLRDLAGKAEKGSEAEKKLTEMADQMAEGDRRATFYEEAHKAGVTNLKLAYLAAVQEDLFDKRGMVNFEQMKKDYPELFLQEKPKPKGNAGEGTKTGEPTHAGMNEFIRASAGRGS